MSEDMSNLINQINNMVKNNEIPNDIKNIINNISNNSQEGSATINNTDISSHSSPSPEFDIATIMKMKKIIEAMNSGKDDPRANLLKSLKPYLKESRKQKVDQYIQIFGMEKILEMLNPLGGDSHK